MARQSLVNDVASQICWKYLHGELDEKTNCIIHDIIHYNNDRISAMAFVYEITYRIGYTNSSLADSMSEVTYKKKKKLIRDRLVEMVNQQKARAVYEG